MITVFFIFSHWLLIPEWEFSSSWNIYCFALHSTLILQILHPFLATSSSNLSHHLNFSLPLLSPFSLGLVRRTFFAGLYSSILITCPAHLSLQTAIKFTLFYQSHSLHISQLLHLLQHPFSTTGPNIFRRTLLPNDLRRFAHSLPFSKLYVSAGLISPNNL